MQEQIILKLSAYIAEFILKQPGRSLNPDEALISGGLVDSFHLVDLALFVEDTFGVHLDDTELNAETFDSLTQLSDIIRQRIS